MGTNLSEKPKCTVRGSLRGGRAMCEYVLVGGEFCSLKQGSCDLQEKSVPGALGKKCIVEPSEKPSINIGE